MGNPLPQGVYSLVGEEWLNGTSKLQQFILAEGKGEILPQKFLS